VDAEAAVAMQDLKEEEWDIDEIEQVQAEQVRPSPRSAAVLQQKKQCSARSGGRFMAFLPRLVTNLVLLRSSRRARAPLEGLAEP
jgi:hypothetical protein